MFDYISLSKENERKYGTDIKRIGQMLLAKQYSERSHFIYELLQNAEDALRRRPLDWSKRTVRFELSKTELVISHFGDPFTEDDVRGVCGIDESTKDITAIGRFGIGFKSVNAYTDRPEVHSGAEHFAIERYVHPVKIDPIECEEGETRIVLPFRENDKSAFEEIAEALKRLGARTLLFLRQIEKIHWSGCNEGGGIYSRGPKKNWNYGAEQISIEGNDKSSICDVSENWIVFSQSVNDEDDNEAGYAELAFLVEYDSVNDSLIKVLPAKNTQLVVYFPTIVATDVRFLIQGPYRTTPSRDNIVDDDWNRSLIDTTAKLLVSALEGLRELGLLGPHALETLPIDHDTFDERRIFYPLYEQTLNAFRQRRLLPANGDKYVKAKSAKLARGKELMKLLSPHQLSALFGDRKTAQWLDGGITQNQTPRLRTYLIEKLNVKEITPENVVSKLDGGFLEKQTDSWILELYTFMAEQQALYRKILRDRCELVRLDNGSHVPVKDTDDNPCAFLPGKFQTDYPTVRNAVCQDEKARKFLKSLGLAEPDPVDDVIRHVLPKYKSGSNSLEEHYQSDIERILRAFETDSSERQKRLKSALSTTPFVAACDAASGQQAFLKPREVYIATNKLRQLFNGVKGCFLVSNHPALGTESSRKMLEATGAARHLEREKCNRNFTEKEFREMRKKSGNEGITESLEVEDYTLRGLDSLMALLRTLNIDDARQRSALLWETLNDFEKNKSPSTFQGTYRWFYYYSKKYNFDAAFVESLRTYCWIVDKEDSFRSPADVTFAELEWVENRFLAERLRFKPDDLDRLASNVGFEPQLLSLLKNRGLTTEAQLQEILDRVGQDDEDGEEHVTSRPLSRDTVINTSQRTPITYVRVHPTEPSTEEGREEHAKKMELEECGIQIILEKEPYLQRTSVNNPGYDLVEKDANDRELRWVEVKVKTGPFAEDSWVALSKKQFETARFRGENYWLYVVENIKTPESANIIRIQNPVEQVKNFVFDHGWREFDTEVP